MYIGKKCLRETKKLNGKQNFYYVVCIEICAIESEVLLRMICSLLSTYTRIAILRNRIECNNSSDFPLNHTSFTLYQSAQSVQFLYLMALHADVLPFLTHFKAILKSIRNIFQCKLHPIQIFVVDFFFFNFIK